MGLYIHAGRGTGNNENMLWLHKYFQKKSTIFWDVTPCSLVEVYPHFGGIYRLHIQGQMVFDPEEGIAFFIDTYIRTSNFTLSENFLAFHHHPSTFYE
jgi:hypothetical protein